MTTCIGIQSPKYLEMAQGHISLSVMDLENSVKKEIVSQIGPTGPIPLG
jgi:hypothetical protein